MHRPETGAEQALGMLGERTFWNMERAHAKALSGSALGGSGEQERGQQGWGRVGNGCEE